MIRVRTKVPEFSLLKQMETYDWSWVETHAAQTADVWHESAGVLAPRARQYSLEEQQVNEDAYDEALLEVEKALRASPLTREARTCTENRIVDSFAKFCAAAMDLDVE